MYYQLAMLGVSFDLLRLPVLLLCLRLPLLPSPVVLAVGAAFSSSQKYAPRAAPRFDSFSAELVREWWQRQQRPSAAPVEGGARESDDGNNRSGGGVVNDDGRQTKLGSVEEVMRSCGGAVQGVREVPVPFSDKSSNDDDDDGVNVDGLYLNRADDGFLFFDDGSYSCGPTTTWIEGLEDDVGGDQLQQSIQLVSSLTLPDRSGVVLWNGHCGDGEKALVVRAYQNRDIASDHQLVLEQTGGDSALLSESVTWTRGVRCRMPSPSQPWMAQRLKWEEAVVAHEDDDDERQRESDVAAAEPGDLHAWFVRQLLPGNGDDSPRRAFEIEGSESPGGGSGTALVSFGCLCAQTKWAKSVVRRYSAETGALRSVELLTGRLIGSTGQSL